MHNGKYVFAQLLDFIDKDVFLRIANKYDGNRYVKHFTCWNQLAVLMFGQLSNRESLRDVALATQAHSGKSYHLGGNVYAFDPTTIDLCLSVFEWALFRKRKGGIKVHTLYDIETQVPTFFHITPAKAHDTKAMDVIPYEKNSFYIFDRGYNDFKRLHNIESTDAFFVVRGKKNNDFKPESWKRRFRKGSGILSDAIGRMDGAQTGKKYPDRIRRIVHWDEESKRKFIFFTNALDIKSITVADLYKNRWQIELFFKWIKQHLKIKKFWGETENAVRIQIYSAITAYCMMAIVQKKLHVERSIYEMLQIASVSLTDASNLTTLFGLSDFNNVKEQNDNSELLLF